MAHERAVCDGSADHLLACLAENHLIVEGAEKRRKIGGFGAVLLIWAERHLQSGSELVSVKFLGQQAYPRLAPGAKRSRRPCPAGHECRALRPASRLRE